MWRKLLRLTKWLLVAGLLAVIVLLLIAPLFVYGRFNTEQPVAELWFEQRGPYEYTAHVATGDLCSYRTYDISGDQWQLDARFIKWKGFVTLLGLESRYRLDRLSGRYSDTHGKNALKPPLTHDLAPALFIDLIARGRTAGASGFLIDTVFGSSVYLDIDTAGRYRVYKTEDALIAKEVPRPPASATGPMTIVIDKACGDRGGIVARAVRALNRVAVRYLK